MSDLKAVIDMGTNTFHLLIAKVDVATGRLEKQVDRKVPVMLGKGGISDGRLTDEAQERGIRTLLDFSQEVAEAGIGPGAVQVFATSAVRSARNGSEFIGNIYQKTGLRVQVINGRREAELIFRGVAASGALDGAESTLVMDIGGGSVEFILNKKKEIVWLESFEIGGQRLMDRFMKNDPVGPSQVTDMNAFLAIQLKPLLEACARHKPPVLAGASGTFDTIHEIARQAGHLEESAQVGAVSPSNITALKEELCRKNRRERLAIPGMIEMRVDMIVMAVCLLDFVVRETEVGQIRCSPFALKEGALTHPNGKSEEP